MNFLFSFSGEIGGVVMPWLNSRDEDPDVHPDLDPERNPETPHPDPTMLNDTPVTFICYYKSQFNL